MSLISPQKNLSNLTTHERERAKRKLAYEENELVNEMGQDSEKKALPTVQRYVAELKELERKQKEVSLEELQKLLRNKVAYHRYLIVLLHKWIKEEDIPKKYSLYVDSNEKGIVLGIENTSYMIAFETCGIPLYDMNACKVMAVRLGNTVSRLEGNLNETAGGIITGTKQEVDLAIAGHGR